MTLLFVYLAIAIGVSFLCSILEAVLLSVTPSFVETTLSDQPHAGGMLSKAKERLDESLSSILILNTFAHTMGAAGVGSQALQVFGAKWEILIAVLLTLAILYFSEIIPKTLGATFWRQLAIPSAYIISWLIKLVYPLVWLSTRLTRLFSRNKGKEISREEIIALAKLGYQGGTLVTQESEILGNILRLHEIRTEQILTPRSVVFWLDEQTTVSKALESEQSKQFTRIPVYKDDIDDITGFVTNRDLFEVDREGHGHSKLIEYRKDLYRVAEQLPVQQLLDLFIRRREHIFLVVDEYGQTSGIVTLEDAIETLLGREIVDETDTVEDLQEFAKGKYRKQLRERDKKN